MNGVIEIENLFKTYSFGKMEVEVLRDVNIKIEKGEFVSIMGPSGSGKSTLLYLIGGLDKPTHGSIKINGKNIAEMNDTDASVMRRKEIGFIFQFYNLIPNLDVEENILMPVLLDGGKISSYRTRLKGILELVGLEDRRKYTPRELSGGQQQRVAIARGLMNSPEIILADEPIGNLDSSTGMGIMELLKSINETEKTTIVQVTHSEEAAVYGSRIINVKDGRVY